jgi:putative flippase GtrA
MELKGDVAAVIFEDACRPMMIASLVASLTLIVKHFIIVAKPGLQIDSPEGVEVEIVSMAHNSSDDGSAALRFGISTALKSDDLERLLLLACDSSGETEKIEQALSSKLDYQNVSNCAILSKEYASFVIRSRENPSASNARKNGFRTVSVLSQMIKSPSSFIRENMTAAKFATVGASGLVVNLLVLTILRVWINILLANAVAVELSVISNFTWNDMYTFKVAARYPDQRGFVSKFKRLLKYNFVSLISQAVNSIIFSALIFLSLWYIWSSIAAVFVAFSVNYFGSSRWAWRVFPSLGLADAELVKN